MKLLVHLTVVFLIFECIFCTEAKKYSNEYPEDKKFFSKLNRPFRMEKLNVIWTKAQQVQPTLPESKLQSLYTQMKLQDKEELQYKQYNAEKDKGGIMAKKLRAKLVEIMKSYGLLEFEESIDDQSQSNNRNSPSDAYKNKSQFKDKKLNKLWEKAELAGLSADELNTLKEEFNHYQTKVDEYYELLNSLDEATDNRHANAVNEEELDAFNEVHVNEEAKDKHREYQDRANNLRDKHHELKEVYKKLEEKSHDGRKKREFVEPKVQNLWKAAQESNFNEQELEALKEELFHFESRLLKLSHLHAEHAMGNEKQKTKKQSEANDRLKEIEKNIKKHTRKVEKLQEELEKQIYRHSEL